HGGERHRGLLHGGESDRVGDRARAHAAATGRDLARLRGAARGGHGPALLAARLPLGDHRADGAAAERDPGGEHREPAAARAAAATPYAAPPVMPSAGGNQVTPTEGYHG